MAFNPPNKNFGSRNPGYGDSRKPEDPKLSSDDKNRIEQIILEDKKAEELVKFANEKAERLKRDDMSTSQLRNIFGEFRKIEAFWEMDPVGSQRRLRLLQPKLAYQKEREKKTAHFCEIMTYAIEQVLKDDQYDVSKKFRNCMNLMEAIVAYHKSIGGKD